MMGRALRSGCREGMMNRRELLRSLGAASAAWALPSSERLLGKPASAWRTFEVTTQIEVLKPWGVTRIWLPAALDTNTGYQRTLGNRFQCPGGHAKFDES